MGTVVLATPAVCDRSWRVTGIAAVRLLRHSFNRGDQPIAAFRDGLDEPRVLDVVSERAPQPGDRAGDDRLGDEDLGPHRIGDVDLRHDLAGVVRQIDQDVHQLGFELDHPVVERKPVEARLDEPSGEPKIGCDRPLRCVRAIHLEAFYPGHPGSTTGRERARFLRRSCTRGFPPAPSACRSPLPTPPSPGFRRGSP